jgi:hypothetical protein
MSEREKYLSVINELGIKLPKRGYIRNKELKELVIQHLTVSKKIKKTRSLPNLQINPKKMSIKKSLIKKPNFNIKKSFFPKVAKLVAIGDIHGDLEAAIKALKLAGVISLSVPNNTTDIKSINWTGGNTWVVQLGDQIDRVRPNDLVNDLCTPRDSGLVDDEGSDLKIIWLFEKLHSQALKEGGALISILGNHELMNVEGDFRYVSPREFKEFGTFFKEKINRNENTPFGFETRKRVFCPGGAIAKKLGNSRYSLVQVGSWLFVHGGVSPKLANEYTIDNINSIISEWLQGKTDNDTMKHIEHIYSSDDETYSPFWNRMYTENDEWNKTAEKKFYITLNILNKKNNRNQSNKIQGMIMGHSPQFMYDKGLNSSCNDRLWRVDVGMSKAFGPVGNISDGDFINRKVQVLIIKNDNKFSILREK